MVVKEFRVVIVGAGKAGRELRAGYFNLLPETRVVAFCDPVVELAERAAAETGADGGYATLGEALERYRPQIVNVCSPPQFHLEQAREALSAGAHVLLEKPAVARPEEIDLLHQHWRAAGTKLTVAHNQKFDAGNRQAVALVRAGKIGRVLNVDRVWIRDPEDDRMMADQQYWAHRLPGGRWGETLPHDLYLARQFLGELSVVSVSGAFSHRRWPWLPADEVKVTLTNGQAYCGLRLSLAAERGLHRPMLIAGSRGSLLVHESAVTLLDARPDQRPLADAAAALSAFGGRVAKSLRRTAGRGLRALGLRRKGGGRPGTGQFRLVESFVNHVVHDGPPPVSWEEAAATQRLAFEIGAALDDLRAAGELSPGDPSG